MTEYAGKGPKAGWDAIHKFMPQAQLSGIVGDRAHTYGYHRGRNYVGRGDYSATQADDRAGPGEAASALDVTLNPSDMITVTKRLIAAVNRNDPRLHGLREFYGTTNGKVVTGRDVRTHNVVTSDPSHLWHIHCSGYRRWADDPASWVKIAEVFAGKGSSTPTPKPEADMPTQIVLSKSVKKPTKIAAAGTWVCCTWDAWNPKGSSGGNSMVLADTAKFFSLTVDLTFDSLPPDQNAWIRVQTLDRSNKQLALYPMAEIRGTTGATALTYSRIGSVSAKTNLRILVSATVACNVLSGQWRALQW